MARRREFRAQIQKNPLAMAIMKHPFLTPEALAKKICMPKSVKRIRAMRDKLWNRGIIVTQGAASQIDVLTREPLHPNNRARKDMLLHPQKPLAKVASDAGIELTQLYRERSQMLNQGQALEKPKRRRPDSLLQIVVQNPGMTGKQLAKAFPGQTNERSWRQLRNHAKNEGLIPKSDLRRKENRH